MDISRRTFLKGSTAGLAGLTLTGLLPGAVAEEAPAAAEAAQAAAPAASETAKGYLLGDVINPQEDFTSCTTDYSHIFSPLKIGNVTMRNRIGKSAAGSEMQKRPDWPEETTLEYYRRFA